MIRARLAQAQLALMLLTRLPAGRLPEPAPSIAAATWAFPLAGLAVGGVAAVVLLAALTLGLPPALAAGLALAAQIIVTGALHEDGLADLADGFWGGRDAARRLEIMRDSRVGGYAVIALVLTLALRAVALWLLFEAGTGGAAVALVVAGMVSRAAMAGGMAMLPHARETGLARSQGRPPVATVALGAALALAAAGLLAGLSGLAAALAAMLTTLMLARLAMARLGGQTGDILGAMQQLAEIAALLCLLP